MGNDKALTAEKKSGPLPNCAKSLKRGSQFLFPSPRDSPYFNDRISLDLRNLIAIISIRMTLVFQESNWSKGTTALTIIKNTSSWVGDSWGWDHLLAQDLSLLPGTLWRSQSPASPGDLTLFWPPGVPDTQVTQTYMETYSWNNTFFKRTPSLIPYILLWSCSDGKKLPCQA